MTNEPVIRDDYFTPAEGCPDGGVTYADASIPAEAHPTVQWSHPLGEVVTALVVVAAIGVGALSGWTALETIWAMSAAGAVSSTLGLFAVFVRLRMLADRTPGDGVASKTAGLAGP